MIAKTAEGMTPDELAIRAKAVKRVLTDLLNRRISAEQAQTWATLVKRGYVATNAAPLRRVSTHYDADQEDEIVEALSGLDELGDRVDGTIDDNELRDLIERLHD